jgi:REP element-mobilizing transposase RayT
MIRAYKSAVSLRVNHLREWKGEALWQRNYYEHIIRSDNDWQRIRDYILSNPSRWHEDRLYQSPTLSVGAQG